MQRSSKPSEEGALIKEHFRTGYRSTQVERERERSRAPLTRLGNVRNDAGESEDKTDTRRTPRVW